MANRKVVIVTGAPLVGKTEYIKANYSARPDFYNFDLAAEYQEITGSLNDFPESEEIGEVYNSLSDKLVDEVLFGKKNTVFEFCTGFPETDVQLTELISYIKESGSEVCVIDLTSDLETVTQRKEVVKKDRNYISSCSLNKHTFVILSNFFEDMQVNKALAL